MDRYGSFVVKYLEPGFRAKSVIVKVNNISKDADIFITGFYPSNSGIANLTFTKVSENTFAVEGLSSVRIAAEQLLVQAGWNTRDAGIGVLLFITSLRPSDGKVIVESMPVSVPLRPGYLGDSRIVIEVNFTPVMVEVLDMGYPGTVLGNTPPPEVEGPCIVGPSSVPYLDYAFHCLYWVHEATYYESPDYNTPLPISYIVIDDPRDISDSVQVRHSVVMGSGGTGSYTVSIGISMANIPSSSSQGSWPEAVIPGPGFTITPPPGQGKIFDLTCIVPNTVNGVPPYTGCKYFGSTVPGLNPMYSGDAIIAVGIKGKVYITGYEFVVKECALPGSMCYKSETIGSSVSLWVVPKSSGRGLDYSIVVDDDLWSDDSMLDNVYNAIVLGEYDRHLVSVDISTWVSLSSTVILTETGTLPLIGASIPVGKLLIQLVGVSPGGKVAKAIERLVASISHEVSSVEAFSLTVSQDVYYSQAHTVGLYTYTTSQLYYVSMLQDFHPTPILVLDPDNPGSGNTSERGAGLMPPGIGDKFAMLDKSSRPP